MLLTVVGKIGTTHSWFSIRQFAGASRSDKNKIVPNSAILGRSALRLITANLWAVVRIFVVVLVWTFRIHTLEFVRTRIMRRRFNSFMISRPGWISCFRAVRDIS
jgi:hypothetical protein